jgi:putative transposase
VRDTGVVQVKAVYLAIGINMNGQKEVLGLWISQTEGVPNSGYRLVTELKNRAVQDIFIACVDGLKGFPEAIETVYPQTAVQLCIVHLVRNSLNYVSWNMRKQIAADLKQIYPSPTVAEQQLAEFEAQWNKVYPPIAQIWRRNWSRIIPFFDDPPEIRRIMYTTNAIESVNMSLRKITENRGLFPSDEALSKLFYLALMNISKKWTIPLHDWKAALNRFSIQFDERMPNH